VIHFMTHLSRPKCSKAATLNQTTGQKLAKISIDFR